MTLLALQHSTSPLGENFSYCIGQLALSSHDLLPFLLCNSIPPIKLHYKNIGLILTTICAMTGQRLATKVTLFFLCLVIWSLYKSRVTYEIICSPCVSVGGLLGKSTCECRADNRGRWGRLKAPKGMPSIKITVSWLGSNVVDAVTRKALCSHGSPLRAGSWSVFPV